MSLIKDLSRLRDDLPLPQRSAPKRSLLQMYLVHEHALLQQSSATRVVSGICPAHDVWLPIERTAGPCPFQERQNPTMHHPSDSGSGGKTSSPSRSNLVEAMFRKARLKRCFKHLIQGQEERRESRKQYPGTPLSGHFPRQQVAQHLDIVDEEASINTEPSAPPPEPIEPNRLLYRGRVEGIIEQSSSQHHVLPVESPASRNETDAEAERAHRRALLRRFFQAARRRDLSGGAERLALGEDSDFAAMGGAPCFTVGGRGRRPTASTPRRRPEGYDEERHYEGSLDSSGGARLRRADLLRRILQSMRESTRERILNANSSTALPSSSFQDNIQGPTSLLASQQLPLRNQPPPERAERRPSFSSTQKSEPTEKPATALDLPIHPRQAAQTRNSYHAVLEAFARMLPSSLDREERSGDPGNFMGTKGIMGAMQAAATHCGIQCQGYIRALQEGIEVIRSGVRSKLILDAASIDGTGVALALQDLDVARTGAGASGVTVASFPPRTPSLVRLPLTRVTRVRCLAESSTGESRRFVILAARTFRGAQGEGVPRSQNSTELPMEGEWEPFGILGATSEEDFRALVLGVASVKSALGSPFRTLKSRGVVAAPRADNSRIFPPTPSSARPTTSADATTAAAACLPWQGARVCIVELAPSLTLFGAVTAVEVEAKRVGREHGLTLRDQNLLICTDMQ